VRRLDRLSPYPLYYQLKEDLVNLIKNGEYAIGQPVPTEKELIEGYGISRATVRQAMLELQNEGYINRVPGKGTFVVRTVIRRGLSRLTSFSEDMKDRGHQVTTRLLAIRHAQPPLHIAEAFKINPEEELLYISRLRLADNVPVALNISHLKLPPGIEITEEDFRQETSLWVLLEQYKGIRLLSADKTLEAIQATQEYAELLQTPIGAPLILEQGITYSTKHLPVEYAQIITCSSRYKYYIHLDR